METGALIIAAGTTVAREGFDPMLQIGAVSALQRLITTFQQAGVKRIVIMTDQKDYPALEKHIARMGVICLGSDVDGRCQMLDLVKRGLLYLQDKCQTILLTPVDVPLFTADTVQRLLESDAQLASPVFEEQIGHPLLLTAALIPLLVQYDGEDGLRGALATIDPPQQLIPVQDGGVLYDVDGADDCHQLLRTHNAKRLRPSVRLRLIKETPFFGPGAAQLLTLIDENDSVRLACQQMGISYSKGWKMIQGMEQEMGMTLVVRQQGGKNGGAAYVTAQGKTLLARFRLLEDRCEQAVMQAFTEIFGTDD